MVAPEPERRRGAAEPQVMEDHLGQPRRQDRVHDEELKRSHRLEPDERVHEQREPTLEVTAGTRRLSESIATAKVRPSGIHQSRLKRVLSSIADLQWAFASSRAPITQVSTAMSCWAANQYPCSSHVAIGAGTGVPSS